MPFAQMLQLVARVTVAQLLTRDDFAKRYAAQSPIHLHECLYPVMQAFDSVVVAADVELGGTEQLYSFMLARDLQKDAGICALASFYQTPGERACLLADGTLPPQIGVMSPILVGLDGVRRMGKSLGNYIGIAEAPYEMMKKFMQIPDALLLPYHELLTDVPLAEARAECESDPRNAKLRLAERVIALFHAPEEARAAADRWQKEISQGTLPEEIPEAELGRELLDGEGRIQAAALLKSTGLAPSTSEAVRLIQGGSAFFYRGDERVRIADRQEWIAVAPGMIVGVGKKRIARLRLRD
jgi:tyrosyl-tRNA synthetase